jgi:hypothetical protein
MPFFNFLSKVVIFTDERFTAGGALVILAIVNKS